MGNRLNCCSSATNMTSKKTQNHLPIETNFKLPSPLPTWPPGEGFARGTIDLGGLEVRQISSFTKVWATHQGGPDNLGATFFDPSPIPEGFSMLGSYGQPNNKPQFGWVLVGKDIASDSSGEVLKPPVDYTLVWSSESLKIKQDGIGYVWLPTPPDGYKAVGNVVTNSPGKPSLDKIRCVRADFTDECQTDSWIWGKDKKINKKGFNAYGTRPSNIGIQAQGVPIGTFTAQNGGAAQLSLACLKNIKANNLYSSMPNLSQIQALFEAYSPWIYFHPDEKYLPSSVSWFFKNGTLLCKKGEESNPVLIEPTGSNLPQGGSNDDTYWLDLPADKAAKELVKGGNLQDVEAYLHVKPMLGATFTDIAIWVFYPFNGPARAKVCLVNIPVPKIGTHIGDWEHLTLRVSNFDGELKSIYFSQHSGGEWVSASELEFQAGNKPVTYASLHGHAFYSKPGLVLQGCAGIGIRNDTAKSKMVMDTGARLSVVAAEFLESAIAEPPWLNYARKWGPKTDYVIADETKKIEKLLPGNLFEKFITCTLPKDILYGEGPTGPKMKNSWSGDEKI